MPKELDLPEAALIVQKYYRGYRLRKYYKIEPLEEKYQKPDRALVIGNDPVIHGLNAYREPTDKIALVGTSGMRSVLLACELGNSQQIPKIIIIDHSPLVCTFWRGMRKLISDNEKAGSEDLFFVNLDIFLKKNPHLFANNKPDALKTEKHNPNVDYPSQDIEAFFKNLFKKFSYSFVCAVMMHATVILQSFEDVRAIIKLRNILDLLKIQKVFLYASNILACYRDKQDQIVVFENMSELEAILAIHTDRCERHGAPENVFLHHFKSKISLPTLFSKNCDYHAKSDKEIVNDNHSQEQMLPSCKKAKVK